jgi:hypothetical protein
MHIPSNLHNAFSLRYKRIEKFHNANLFGNTIFASIVKGEIKAQNCESENAQSKKQNSKLQQRRGEIEIISPFCVLTLSG